MSAIKVCMLVFVVIEILNMLELYFMQDQCKFNGLCIFRGWEKAKEDPDVHELLRYLINWLAGIKMIVIGLVLILVFTAPEKTLLFAAVALIITIGSFFWRMVPMIRRADAAGRIQPAGRSRSLAWMVASLEIGLVLTIAGQHIVPQAPFLLSDLFPRM
jgi:hypothetical protein